MENELFYLSILFLGNGRNGVSVGEREREAEIERTNEKKPENEEDIRSALSGQWF